ncbi:hypothetical protein [Paenibacillus sp. PL2-23]|uniref:hypothetical protein n=1 Tax=Paenibacillus sp. PL2-23 TaxID=2100729 RepID=UPI0030F8ABC9
MTGDTLKEREGRLQLARAAAKGEPRSEGDETTPAAANPPGPADSNEQWKALYARIREVTEGLRQ